MYNIEEQAIPSLYFCRQGEDSNSLKNWRPQQLNEIYGSVDVKLGQKYLKYLTFLSRISLLSHILFLKSFLVDFHCGIWSAVIFSDVSPECRSAI